MAPSYILGVSAFYHDSAACLLADGEIVAAAQEERFSRKKGDPAFPSRAVAYCLAQAGIKTPDLAYVGVWGKPLPKFERLLGTSLGAAPPGFAAFRPPGRPWRR